MKNTVGSFMLKGIAIILGFNILFTLVKTLVTNFNDQLQQIINTFGHGWLFSIFIDFMLSMWSWIFLLLTDIMAFATLLALSMIYEAYETEWR